MKKIKIGDEVVITKYATRGVVTDYFDDSWIIVNAKGIEYNVAIEEINIADSPSEESVITPEFALGLQFNSVNKLNGELSYFELFAVNHTTSGLLIDYAFYLDQTLQSKMKKELLSGENIYLHEFKKDQLNDHPEFRMDCELKKSIEGKMNAFGCAVKLKPKQFFAFTDSAEFKLTGKFEIILLKEFPDLKSSEKILIPEPEVNSQQENKNELLEKIYFPDFIDLHAETLFTQKEKPGQSEILNSQLRAFTEFLDQAIRHDQKIIYAVHGIGSGRLKFEIEKIIKTYPEVTAFNNDYNPRFGFGATEIHLG